MKNCDACDGCGYQIIVVPVCCGCPYYDSDDEGNYISGSERCCGNPAPEQQQEICEKCNGGSNDKTL